MDPIKLTNIIKNQVGEVKFVGLLGDGFPLTGCGSEEQGVKALKLQTVGKVVVVKMVRVGERMSKGVIYEIPLSVKMKKLVKNLEVKCESVVNVKQLIRRLETLKLSQFWQSSAPKSLLTKYSLAL